MHFKRVLPVGASTLTAPSRIPFIAICGLVVIFYAFGRYSSQSGGDAVLCSTSLAKTSSMSRMGDVLPPVRKRDMIGAVLEDEGFTTGVELGVQNGEFSMKWPSCKMYLLVDVWTPLENYGDGANKAQDEQDKIYQNALRNTRLFDQKRVVCRNFTTNCAKQYQHMQFDYIYVDARHDYAGVLVDLVDWWPLLREGGIMAGHDFVTQDEISWTKQNWTINYDGTVDSKGRAVWGAVVEFFHNKTHPERYRQITQTYQEGSWWTWMVRK